MATPEDCTDVMFRDLITNDYIIHTEYRGRCRTKVTLYEIPDCILGEHLGAYFMQYGQLVSVTPGYEMGEWGFELMSDRESFTSILNRLEIGGKNTPSSGRGGNQFVGSVAQLVTLPLPTKRISSFESRPSPTPSKGNYSFCSACNWTACG